MTNLGRHDRLERTANHAATDTFIISRDGGVLAVDRQSPTYVLATSSPGAVSRGATILAVHEWSSQSSSGQVKTMPTRFTHKIPASGRLSAARPTLGDMTPDTATLIRDGLALDVDQRAGVANALLESLHVADDTNYVDAAWGAEAARRLAEVRAGSVEVIDADEHYSRLRASLTE